MLRISNDQGWVSGGLVDCRSCGSAGWLGGRQRDARQARRGALGRLIGEHGPATPKAAPEQPEGKKLAPAIVEHMDDLRLNALRKAAEGWRRSAAPRRVVVDQVCLVSDLPTFLEAIAAWDERHYFPILIDEPAWTIPFVRQFHPARVVRYRGKKNRARSSSEANGTGGSAHGETAWLEAIDAVRRACSTPPEPGGADEGAGRSGSSGADSGVGAG